ncbi:MAG: signal peptidase I [Polyangiaceae bacterium]
MQKLTRNLGWVVGVLVVLTLVLRLVAFDVWTMPSDPYLVSAAPTLGPADTVIMLRRGTPAFGELVRCTDPQDANAWVLGRIAGMPGDDVEIEGHRLTVNGTTYRGETACAQQKVFVTHPDTLKEVELACEVVPMGGGWHYALSAMGQFTEQKKTAHVGAGKVFLVSDNSSMHDDSRDFGLVDFDTCTARPLLRLWGTTAWADDANRFSWVH